MAEIAQLSLPVRPAVREDERSLAPLPPREHPAGRMAVDLHRAEEPPKHRLGILGVAAGRVDENGKLIGTAPARIAARRRPEVAGALS